LASGSRLQWLEKCEVGLWATNYIRAKETLEDERVYDMREEVEEGSHSTKAM